MMLRLFTLAALAVTAFAQPPMPGRGEFRQPAELKTYLSLTDQQVTSLQSLLTQQADSRAALHEQIRTKQAALDEALKSSGASAAVVGQMLLDIQALRQQLTSANQQLQTQAVALLTAEQKTKLAALASAQALQPAIRQAEALRLLSRPEGPEVGPGGFRVFRMGPGPMGDGGMPMNRRGRPAF